MEIVNFLNFFALFMTYYALGWFYLSFKEISERLTFIEGFFEDEIEEDFFQQTIYDYLEEE